ncbi:MAG TPA: DMT family transporter [Gaiellales bacterium]|jgi:drug/metabolite transporter (DMT)-like permease
MPRTTTARADRVAGLMLLTTPVIWGLTFPAAKLALKHTNAWTFTAWSRVLGLLALIAVLAVVRPPRDAWRWGLVPAGALLGFLMFAAFALQSVGLRSTTATNAGFITVLYVVFAPLGAALVARRRPPRVAAVCLPMALAGLALLSLHGLDLHRGDALVLACSIAIAGHIVAVSLFVARYSAIGLAAAQLAATTVIHTAFALPHGLDAGQVAGDWRLYLITGVLGSGAAFSIQVLAQQQLTPLRTSVLLAGEALFSALASAVWLGERLDAREWCGVALMLGAIAVSEAQAWRGAPEPASAA